MKAGIDFGAKNISWAILDGRQVSASGSVPHNGHISDTYNTVLAQIRAAGPSVTRLGITGSLKPHGVEVFDPIIASVEAARLLETRCRNILSIGCESFYMIRLDENFNYVEHFVNSDCAAGTGSFIDQQAQRLGMDTPELAQQAAAFQGTAPSIATRCAVFAKSDIIHAQAQGFSKQAIAAGLCEGVARSVLANTLKGREISGDLLFIGGMSQNPKVADQVRTTLDCRVRVHELGCSFNAVGAALLGEITWDRRHGLVTVMGQKQEARPALETGTAHYPDFLEDEYFEAGGIEITRYAAPDTPEVYIGIDVGSTSTKAVVTALDGRVLAGLYGRTQGDPVQAVTGLLAQVKTLFEETPLEIRGVATTGSGRELIREVVGADTAVNEITAHARGAAFLDPEVDTIIEIGGQDSKFTRMDNGAVTHAVMNYVCAAGTGSFIEEQAKRLGMTLDEISAAVNGRTAPFTSDRCTVYMERDLNIFLSQGWEREQIMAAVLYSVRDNYLSKVMGRRPPGKKIYFQGATARNKALVAVFEAALGRPVHVSKYCHLTGALGCAVTLMQEGYARTRFTGIDFSCEVASEICDLCPNRCDLRVYTVGEKKTAWGLKCGRDYEEKKVGRQDRTSQLENAFKQTFQVPSASGPDGSAGPNTPDGSAGPDAAPVIGIPDTLFMKEYTPLFKPFFQDLGFKVRVASSSSKTLQAGMNMINADFCAPMALAHGLVQSLHEKQVDLIFLPTLINQQGYGPALDREELFREKSTDAYFCYYSSYAATIINNLAGHDFKGKLLLPKLRLNNTPLDQAARTLARDLAGPLCMDPVVISDAFIRAWSSFTTKKQEWIQKGNERLAKDNGRIKILLLGRPYALFDRRINLGIPARLEQMGFALLNQSMLDLGAVPEDKRPGLLDNMHWYFGQQILLALDTVRNRPDVYPVFLTCFRCSPDAYLINYFREFMEKLGKPFLILQLDEHSSDVGYMTRIEAAADTFINDFSTRKSAALPPAPPFTSVGPDAFQPGDTVLIPMTDLRINRLHQALFQVLGFDARVVPLDKETLGLGYQFATGGECLPNVAVAGSLIATLEKENIPAHKAVLYLPAICLSCNYNQYANLVKLACTKAGMAGVRVMNANGLGPVPGIPARANALLLSVTILSSILNKLQYRFQPYETEPGATLAAVEAAEEIIRQHLVDKKSLFNAAKQIRALFEPLPQTLPDGSRKPRIGILGDLYAKFNHILNDALCDHAQALGGEILPPAYNELVVHTMHADVVEHNADRRPLDAMTRYESKFEQIFQGLLDRAGEPDPDECWDLMKDFGLDTFIAGETAVSLGRMLYYIKHDVVDAVIHVNPVFCCPGVISSSIFRKIQERFHIPIIDLFYDGTNKPNRMIDPHMFYLTQKEKMS